MPQHAGTTRGAAATATAYVAAVNTLTYALHLAFPDVVAELSLGELRHAGFSFLL